MNDDYILRVVSLLVNPHEDGAGGAVDTHAQVLGPLQLLRGAVGLGQCGLKFPGGLVDGDHVPAGAVIGEMGI